MAEGWSTRNREKTIALLLLIATGTAVVISLCVGAANISVSHVWQGLWGGDDAVAIIVRDIRLPRTLLAVFIGAFLGLSGAALQGLMQNPLAEAAIFGAPQAAALAAVGVLYSGISDALSIWLPLSAIAGAFLSCVLLYAMAGRHGTIMAFILAGLSIGSFAGAAISLVINLSPNPFAITEIVFWLMGSFEDRSLRHVAISLPFVILAAVLLLRNGRAYRALTLGQDAAASMGISIAIVQWSTIGAVAVGIGAGVAVSGAIGFVGLIAPHVARAMVGADPQRILIPSALVGAMLLTLADIGARLIPASSEIKVGALTAVLGAPLFAYLVFLRRRQPGSISP